jgi:hypothetical protein
VPRTSNPLRSGPSSGACRAALQKLSAIHQNFSFALSRICRVSVISGAVF